MGSNDTMFAVLYGEMEFTELSATIHRLVGFMEVPVPYTDDTINLIDRMGYDYICLQQAKHLSEIYLNGVRYYPDNLYMELVERLRVEYNQKEHI